MYQKLQDIDSSKKDASLSDFKMAFNMIKSVVGIGLLSISFTLKDAGWLFLLIMLFIALITLYNALTLGKLVQKYTNEVDYIIDYPTLGKFVYGNICKNIINTFWATEIFMISLVVVNLGIRFLSEISFLKSVTHVWIEFIVVILYLSISFIRNYDSVSLISLGGIFSIVFLVIIIFIKFCMTEHLELDTKIIDFSKIPNCIGISLFSFGGHVIFPEIYDTLKKKDNIYKIIYICWGIITLFTLGFAILGFTIFGSHTLASIASDIESGSIKDCLLISLFLNLFFSFPLNVNPLLLKLKCVNWIILRICYMAILFCICHFWKSFIQMMSLTGVVLENMTSLILPPLFLLKLEPNMNLLHKTLNIVIIIFGLFILIFGLVIEIKKF